MFEESRNIKKLNKKKFNKDHFDTNKELLIMLYSPSCPHCKVKEKPWTNLSNIPNLMDNLDIAECDILHNEEIRNALKINTVPHFMYQYNNKLYEIPYKFISDLIELLQEPINVEDIKEPYENKKPIENANTNPNLNSNLNTKVLSIKDYSKSLPKNILELTNKMSNSPKPNPKWLKDEGYESSSEDENEEEDEGIN